MKILIVDDDADSRLLLRKTLEWDGYSVMTASNGLDALKLARETPPDMIVSDILMPVMDGFQLCRQCMDDSQLAGIPFVFYSASYTDKQDEEFMLSMGVVKFIVKPMEPDEFLKTVKDILNDYKKGLLQPPAVLEKKDEESFLKGYNARLIRQLEKKVQDLETSNAALRRSEAELKELFESFVRTMVSALDAKSRWTKGHSERVAVYAEKIGKELGFDDKKMAELSMAALLHDIGKIGLRDSVLDKVSELTKEEFEEVKDHARLGAKMLEGIQQLKNILPAIRSHHERLDGSGYPDGISGLEIGLYAGIIHIADSFDSMTSDRPYRQSQDMDYAVLELKRLSGLHFNPELVGAFLRGIDRAP